jgi:hypothetical protein
MEPIALSCGRGFDHQREEIEMRTLRGIALMAAAGLAIVPLLAAPALAKVPGEDSPVTSAVILGPGGSRATSLGSEQAMDFALDNGVLQAATEYALDLRALVPPSAPTLGPRYEVTYVLTPSFAETVGLDGTTLIQEIYPLATGGPWAFTAPGQHLHASGWWPVSPDVVQTLKASAILTTPVTTRVSSPGGPLARRGAGPALLIAVGLVALIALFDTLAGRGRNLPARS